MVLLGETGGGENLMQAYGRNQTLLEPRPGGMVRAHNIYASCTEVSV